MKLSYCIKHIWIWLCRIPHRKGYGIHSPFAFNLVTGVIYERGAYYAYDQLKREYPTVQDEYPTKDLQLLLRLCNDARPRRGVVVASECDAVVAYMKAGCRECEFTHWDDAKQMNLEKVDWLYVGREADVQKVLGLMVDKMAESAVIVVRDIYQSDQVKQAWDKMKRSERVRVTFDLYDFGLAYFEQRLNKEDYVISY